MKKIFLALILLTSTPSFSAAMPMLYESVEAEALRDSLIFCKDIELKTVFCRNGIEEAVKKNVSEGTIKAVLRRHLQKLIHERETGESELLKRKTDQLIKRVITNNPI